MGAADAHDAGWPGGSRPKWGQLMLMMRARQGVQGQSGAADAHDAGSPGGSRPKWGQLMLMMQARQEVQGQSGGS